jgi:hypothetical protein
MGGAGWHLLPEFEEDQLNLTKMFGSPWRK